MKKTSTSTNNIVRDSILEEMKKGKSLDQYIPGEVLSEKFHITRSAVWKHINKLRELGYEIISKTNKGYKLIKIPDLLLPAEIKDGLGTLILGREIIYYSKVTSTNEVARDLANHGADDGAIVLADIQSRGRGRRGRTWVSPYGGLWLTIILRPKIPPHHAPVLTLLTGVVVAEVIQKMTGLKTTLKWPNDVRINEKKVCGILTELSAEQDLISYILVGIGLNVNLSVKKFPKELRDYATSIEIEFKKKLNRVEIGQRLLNKFEKEYLHLCENLPESIKKIVKKWRLLSDTLGRHVKIETISGTTEGLAADIESDGALLIITDNGEEERIIAGDCVYLDQ